MRGFDKHLHELLEAHPKAANVIPVLNIVYACIASFLLGRLAVGSFMALIFGVEALLIIMISTVVCVIVALPLTLFESAASMSYDSTPPGKHASFWGVFMFVACGLGWLAVHIDVFVLQHTGLVVLPGIVLLLFNRILRK